MLLSVSTSLKVFHFRKNASGYEICFSCHSPMNSGLSLSSKTCTEILDALDADLKCPPRGTPQTPRRHACPSTTACCRISSKKCRPSKQDVNKACVCFLHSIIFLMKTQPSHGTHFLRSCSCVKTPHVSMHACTLHSINEPSSFSADLLKETAWAKDQNVSAHPAKETSQLATS